MNNTRRVVRDVAWVSRGVSLALAVGLVACAENPLVSRESDFGVRPARERLREIPRTDLAEHRKAQIPDPAAASDAARKRFEGVERTELTIEECRAAALRNNLDLRVAVVDPALAAERVSEENARFESAFTLRAAWAEFDQPTASALVSGKSNAQSLEPGVRIPLRTGGTATVSLPMTRNENDNSFSTLNPSYTSDLELSISHPLLRGAGRRAATAALRIASYESSASLARTKLEVIRQLAAVDRAYWRAFQAQRELEVRQRQHEVAEAQLRNAERRVRAGAAGEIEMIRAQAGLADRLEAIIVAQNVLLDRQRELKRVINIPGLDLESKTLAVPSSPPDPVLYEFDRPRLLADAMQNRMDMLELEIRLAADAARLALEQNQSLPLLSLDYTYRVNGLGDSISRGFKQLGENDFEDWQLGLAAEIPLGNEAARSRIRQAILARLQRLASKEARALSIKQEVLAATDALDAGWQRILASRQSAVLNARALQAEQRQYEVGTTTSTNVLDAAARLAEAQSAEIRALTDYQIAQVDLAFATGTLLGAGKVEWDPAPRPDPSRVTTEMTTEMTTELTPGPIAP